MTDQEGADATEDADAAESNGSTDAEEYDDEKVVEGATDRPDDELVERVKEADPEDVAREIASLRDRAEDAEEAAAEYEDRVEDLESRLKRKQADFQNYKKRMEKRREQERERATEDLVERLLDVRDNLQRALDQDAGTDIRDGVETTLRQFDQVLEWENVETIEPDLGGEVDPQRHEVLMRVESDRPAGTVDRVHRLGYEMAGKVLRPAQVTVSDADDGGTRSDEAGTVETDEEDEADADEAGTEAAEEAGVDDTGAGGAEQSG